MTLAAILALTASPGTPPNIGCTEPGRLAHQLWVMRYDGPGHNTDQANSVAVSATGNRAFVTGYGAGATTGDDYITIGYNG